MSNFKPKGGRSKLRSNTRESDTLVMRKLTFLGDIAS